MPTSLCFDSHITILYVYANDWVAVDKVSICEKKWSNFKALLSIPKLYFLHQFVRFQQCHYLRNPDIFLDKRNYLKA